MERRAQRQGSEVVRRVRLIGSRKGWSGQRERERESTKREGEGERSEDMRLTVSDWLPSESS
eukprot:6755330-Prymnesium_polylepis.2